MHNDRFAISDKIYKLERQKAFVDVADKFRLINEDSVIVIADSNLSERLRTEEPVSIRELQRGSVNIRKYTLRQLNLQECELPVLSTDQYDNFLGYMKNLL